MCVCMRVYIYIYINNIYIYIYIYIYLYRERESERERESVRASECTLNVEGNLTRTTLCLVSFAEEFQVAY